MRILTYDEVDHEQVLEIHLSGLGWPLTEDRMRAKVEHDRRISKRLAIYGVSGDKVLGQVIAMRIPTRTIEGIEKVLGVAEVATAPGESRKGIATALMQRTEEMAIEEGVRFSWLTTGRHMVAHNLYSKLGYSDMSSFPRGFRHVPRSAAKPRGIELRQYRKSDTRALSRIHSEHVKGGLGFTERQPDFIEMMIAMRQLGKEDVLVARKSGKVVGYAASHMRQEISTIVEVAAPNEEDFRSIVAAIEAGHKGALTIASSLVSRKQRDRFESLGYRISPVHWFALMAKPLDRSTSREEMNHLYGFDDGRFTFMAMDGF